MSSLALMRWLESAPERYDAGMRWLTFGRLRRVHETLAEWAAPRPDLHVLEIGCGTGAVSERLAARGARVTALDHNAEMLARARRRVASQPGVVLVERTAAELDAFAEGGFDAVVASLCLSEMALTERAFVLRAARRRLRANGRCVIADEVWPDGRAQRALQVVLRAPQAALAWGLVGTLSRPIPDLRGELREAGFRVVRERRWLWGTLAAIEAVVAADALSQEPPG